MSELAQNTEVGEGNGAPDGATLVVENPATGEAVRAVPVMHREELTGMVAAARAAQPAWAALTFAERGHVMRRAQRWMISNPQRVLDVVVSETGKTIEDAQIADLGYTISALAFWAKRSEGYLADERVASW